METFIIDVPVPSMGATVSELVVISLKVAPGDRVAKGQKIAELESEKSIFEYEAPGDGKVIALEAKPGQSLIPGALFLRLETSDASLRHLESRKAPGEGQTTEAVGAPAVPRTLVWTPKAAKLAQEAGLEPATITDIVATGPGGRVSGDDIASYLASRR